MQPRESTTDDVAGGTDNVRPAPHRPVPAAVPEEGEVVLRRSVDDRVVAGVAGGLGAYLGIDPVLLRLAFVLLTIGGGAGVLLYVVAWVVMPEARPGERTAAGSSGDRNTGAMVLGVLLIVAGGVAIANRLVPELWGFVPPLVLVVIGLVVVIGGRR